MKKSIEYNSFKGVLRVENNDSRIYLFDNLKAVLITLVVFGHVIEPVLTGKMKLIYVIIYSFHMPLFVFCSGYLSKYNPKKILTNIIYPFFLFQILYILFDRICLGNTDTLFQFTTPYWIMWYLFAMVIWSMILPFIEIITNSKIGILLTICVSVLLGIISGFDSTLGYYMSLSRVIYFLPFFVIGFCIKKAVKVKTLNFILSKWYVKCAMGVLAMFTILWLYLNYKDMDVRQLYGSYGYALEGYTFMTRMFVYMIALFLSLFLLAMIPKKKVIFTYIGQRSLPIYLLHGFIMRLLPKTEIFNYVHNQYGRIIISFIISILIVLLFSSGPIKKITQPLLAVPFTKLSNKKCL